MRFKEWLQREDTMAVSAEPGNQPDPVDRGLYDNEGPSKYRDVPRSPLADKLFKGKAFMKKDQKVAKAV